MNDYIIYCTEEQTNRAIRLGCPCENPDDYTPAKVPTTQQMIGWFREEYNINIYALGTIGTGFWADFHYGVCVKEIFPKNGGWNTGRGRSAFFDTAGQAELAAIDAALDYLETL